MPNKRIRPTDDSDIVSSELPSLVEKAPTVFVSQYNIGDTVNVNFKQFGHIRNAKIFKVQFIEDKVLYDVLISGAGIYAKLYGVDAKYIN